MGCGASGFEIVAAVFSAAEIDRLVSELGAAPFRRSRAGARHLLSVSAVAELAHDPRLMALAADVLGTEPLPFGATLFDKSADANWLVGWHQDTALPMRERSGADGFGPWSEKDGVAYARAPAAALERVVALRVHLDDSNADNGPMRVLPGTHELGLLTEEQIHAQARRVTPLECIVARGGVLALRPLLIHASSKVTASRSRRVVHFEYVSSIETPAGMRLPPVRMDSRVASAR